MNKDTVKGNWNVLKGKIKQRWGDLTEDEITKTQGNIDEIRGLIQKKYGYSKDEARKRLSEL